MPKDYRVAFDKTISEKCAQYLKDNDPKMIFIYGEFDPWSAAAVSFGSKENMYKAICPGGSHGARISSLPDRYEKRSGEPYYQMAGRIRRIQKYDFGFLSNHKIFYFFFHHCTTISVFLRYLLTNAC